MSQPFRISQLSDAAAYVSMLERDKGNLLYASPDFLAFLRDATGAETCIVVAERGDEILGALPYAIYEAPGIGRVINSLPWWGSHGSIVLNRTRPDIDKVRKALLGHFVEQVERIAPLSTTMILLPAEEEARELYESILQPTAVDGRVGQISELPDEGPELETRLLASFRQKTRNLVRKGLTQGFDEIVTDEPWGWDFLVEMHLANIAALGGRAKPRAHFESLRSNIPTTSRRLSIAMDGGQPVAGMLTVTFNRTVEYLTPVIDVRHRPRQPLSFLIYRGMIDAIKGGAMRWNWGGTWLEQKALHHFKAGFGAVDYPYSYLIKASQNGIQLFRERKDELPTLFPAFYTYPYSELV